jgi:hypothetical protein
VVVEGENQVLAPRGDRQSRRQAIHASQVALRQARLIRQKIWKASYKSLPLCNRFLRLTPVGANRRENDSSACACPAGLIIRLGHLPRLPALAGIKEARQAWFLVASEGFGRVSVHCPHCRQEDLYLKQDRIGFDTENVLPFIDPTEFAQAVGCS